MKSLAVTIISIKHLCIGLVAFCVLFPVKEPITISWKSSRLLTWNDFKEKPVLGTTAVALTASGITFGYSVQTLGDEVKDFKTTVYAHFYPERSWVNLERANAYILKHEQLHFDITELHVRKFRYAISRLRPNNNIDKQLSHLHDSIRAELRKMQKAYDEESNHSIEKEAQQQWIVFVAKELKLLERFASK